MSHYGTVGHVAHESLHKLAVPLMCVCVCERERERESGAYVLPHYHCNNWKNGEILEGMSLVAKGSLEEESNESVGF